MKKLSGLFVLMGLMATANAQFIVHDPIGWGEHAIENAANYLQHVYTAVNTAKQYEAMVTELARLLRDRAR